VYFSRGDGEGVGSGGPHVTVNPTSYAFASATRSKPAQRIAINSHFVVSLSATMASSLTSSFTKQQTTLQSAANGAYQAARAPALSEGEAVKHAG